MANYYGIDSYSENLTHYGVKGMRWGVRKAIKSGNTKKLDRQYAKAMKKLNKLNARTDVDMQNVIAKKHRNRAIGFAGLGLAGLGVYARNEQLGKQAQDILNNAASVSDVFKKPRARKKKIVNGKPMDVYISGVPLTDPDIHSSYYHPGIVAINENRPTTIGHNGSVGTVSSITTKRQTPYKTIRTASTAVGLAGLAGTAYQAGRAIAAKSRTTKKGHAKAVAKRDAWRNEMAEVFKGTKYGKPRKKHG